MLALAAVAPSGVSYIPTNRDVGALASPIQASQAQEWCQGSHSCPTQGSLWTLSPPGGAWWGGGTSLGVNTGGCAEPKPLGEQWGTKEGSELPC